MTGAARETGAAGRRGGRKQPGRGRRLPAAVVALLAAVAGAPAGAAAPATPGAVAPIVLEPLERELDALLMAEPSDRTPARLEALRLDPRWAAPRWQALIGVHRCSLQPDADALAALAAGGRPGADPTLHIAWLKCAQWVRDQSGDPSGNYADAQAAWMLLDAHTPPTLAFRVARDFSDEAAYAGMPDEALVATGRALDIARALRDPAREAAALDTLAMVQSDLGRHEEALSNSDRALALDGERLRRAEKLVARSALQLNAGRYDDAMETLRAAESVARAAGRDDTLLAARVNRAEVLLKTGRQREALELTAEMLPESERVDVAYIKPYVWGVRAFALVANGQVDAGIAMQERAMRWFEQGGDHIALHRSARDWAQQLASVGRWQQAYEAIVRAAELRAKTERTMREKNADVVAATLESSRKDRDIERLHHQSETARLQGQRWIAVAAAVLLSAASLLFVHLRLRRANRALRQANAALEWESTHDALTRAHNRRYFVRFFAERRASGGGRALLVLLDVDHFKSINDRHGHEAGDRVLEQISQRLRDCVRDADRVVRWGGEEFLVFLDEPADAESERALVLRLLDAVAGQPIALRDGTLSVTASLGFASVKLGQGFDIDAAIRDVDGLLFLAKRGGRCRAIGRLQGSAYEPVVLMPPSGAVAVRQT